MKKNIHDYCHFLFDDLDFYGFGNAVITTNEFTPKELMILRAFEWDRINFSTVNKSESIAKIEGISIKELEDWRVNTRRKCGVNVVK